MMITDMSITDTYHFWLRHTVDDREIHEELMSLKGDHDAIKDRFFKELSFGTGGLRGKIGAGTDRMNRYTVGRVTFGLADHLIENGQKSICIAFDSRNKSADFARTVAQIASYKGLTVYLFDRIMPTPVLSYAVRELHAGAGVVITASHNPKEYNGYKVYNEKGCQITDSAADEIAQKIASYGYFNEYAANDDKIILLHDEILASFLKAMEAYSFPYDKNLLPKIVYTPLNGTGNLPMKMLFSKMGVEHYEVVPEQELPNGDFPTCPFPNPEEKTALSRALALAERNGAELVMATDPDADRIGLAVKTADGSFRLLNGNETGILMEYFILQNRRKQNRLSQKSYIVKTIVTTPLAEQIAASFGVRTYNVLTGFKYIGEMIDRRQDEEFVFGMEESYGYLVGTHVRDKDAISAAMIILEAIAYYASQGDDPVSALEKIYARYGYSSSVLVCEYFEGENGMRFMASFMDSMRKDPWRLICGEAIGEITDYSVGTDNLPKSNVLRFSGNSISVIIRPSGTEPKLKFYITCTAENERAANQKAEEVAAFVRKEVKRFE